MQMPVEILEKLGSRAKRIASPEVNLEQLRREDESTRRQWWEELKANKREYDNLSYERDKFLESNMALARLKLILSFIDSKQTPPEHNFRNEELDLLREFEQFIVYDRLSAEEIREYVRSGREEGGVLKLAKRAAVGGYDQIYKIIEQRNIPSDLAFAFQRIYKDRIGKMEMAASEMKLTEVYKEVEKVEIKGISAKDVQLVERAYIAQVQARLKNPGETIKWYDIKTFDRRKEISSALKGVKPSKRGFRGAIASSLDWTALMLKLFPPFGPIAALLAIFSRLLSGKPPAGFENMPVGLGIGAADKKRRFIIFKKTVLMLETRVLSDYKELFLSGHDGDIRYGDLMIYVEQAAAKAKKYPYILGLAATAGWEGKAIEYAKEAAGLSPNLSLVLINLRDKQMHYKADDERLGKFLPLLKA